VKCRRDKKIPFAESEGATWLEPRALGIAGRGPCRKGISASDALAPLSLAKSGEKKISEGKRMVRTPPGCQQVRYISAERLHLHRVHLRSLSSLGGEAAKLLRKRKRAKEDMREMASA